MTPQTKDLHGFFIRFNRELVNGMKIEHSPLKNEFISFWIETHVDGVLRYETIIDFMRCAWCTTHALHDQPILLQGDLDTVSYTHLTLPTIYSV